jgi:pilus assembly protein CpaB
MRRGRILILLGLILAVGTAAAVFILLQGAAQQPEPEVNRVQVVVANQPIPEEEPVEGRLGLKAVPAEMVPEGAMRDLNATKGKLAAGPIPQGTIIQPALLVTPEQLALEGELGKLVEEGFEAIAFPINELSSVSYGIQPGDHVDVLMTFVFVDIDQDTQIQEPLCPPDCPGEGKSPTSISQRPRRTAQLTVQDIKVLGVGRWNYAAPPPEAQEGEEPPPAQPPSFITLMVSPQDALVLKLARELGANMQLAVRAQDDRQVFSTQQVTLDYIMARFGVEVPVKQPYAIGVLSPGEAAE